MKKDGIDFVYVITTKSSYIENGRRLRNKKAVTEEKISTLEYKELQKKLEELRSTEISSICTDSSH